MLPFRSDSKLKGSRLKIAELVCRLFRDLRFKRRSPSTSAFPLLDKVNVEVRRTTPQPLHICLFFFLQRAN